MIRQQHHIKKMTWFNELSEYGKAEIEPSIYIRNAVTFPDVCAEIDGKNT